MMFLSWWIEDEEFSDSAEIEHAPGLAAIVSDVRAGHVAGDEDGICIVRADNRAEHGTAAARADDFEVAGAMGEGGGAVRVRSREIEAKTWS